MQKAAGCLFPFRCAPFVLVVKVGLLFKGVIEGSVRLAFRVWLVVGADLLEVRFWMCL